MGALLDASFLVDLLRERERARDEALRLAREELRQVIPEPATYEVLAGIRHRGTGTEAARFRRVVEGFERAPFDAAAADAAAEVRAELLGLGQPKGAVDVMIAGIAKARDHVLVTRDEDFQVVADAVELEVRGY